jgi:hypothetical protein
VADKLQQNSMHVHGEHTEVHFIHRRIYDSISSTSVALTTFKDIKKLGRQAPKSTLMKQSPDDRSAWGNGMIFWVPLPG